MNPAEQGARDFAEQTGTIVGSDVDQVEHDLMSGLDAVEEIVERIMTMHWDMAACPCWVCVDGRAAGCRPRELYLHGRYEGRAFVRVDMDRRA